MRVTTSTMSPSSHRGRHHRRAIGAPGAQQAAVVARQRVHPSFGVTNQHGGIGDQRSAQAAIQQLLLRPSDVAAGGFPCCDAVAGVCADHQFGIAADGLDATDVATPAQRAVVGARAGAPPIGMRAHSKMSPTRSGGPTRSARRSISLVPRGTGHGHFPAHAAAGRIHGRATASLARPAACSLKAASTPGCDSVSASPGRCKRHSGTPSSASNAPDHAVDAHHEHALAGHQRRAW